MGSCPLRGVLRALLTRRSQVRILTPLPHERPGLPGPFFGDIARASDDSKPPAGGQSFNRTPEVSKPGAVEIGAAG
jgi:hypothetical protein